MAAELLVNNRIRQGADLLEALDRAGFPVTAAFWYLNDGRWRYVIATPVVDKVGPRETYGQVDDILRSSDVDIELWDIAVVSPQDQLPDLMHSMLPTGPKDIKGLQFGGGTINHVFIEGVYVYRAA